MVLEHTSSIDSLSDEELYRLIDGVSRDRVQTIGHVPFIDGRIHAPVWRIAPDAVAKVSRGQSEAYTMQLVRDNTSIPVPTIRRVLPDRRSTTGCYWIVMDYIEGSTLLDLWDTLTDERKHSIIDVLARYVRELQGVRLPNPSVPGPLHPDGKPVKCNASFFSDDNAGPFSSYQEMTDCLTPPILSSCHMDIHPRNILIDKVGTPWLVDWGAAGVYPTWFEYAAIAVSVKADYRLAAVPAWKDLVANASTIAGDYARYYEGYLLVLFSSANGLNFDALAEEIDFPDDYFEKLGMVVD
ncbi:kinase-like protein [Ganoderma leucocontextum]|nr:kinase-like protein [Ganoderma leucocontextum]